MRPLVTRLGYVSLEVTDPDSIADDVANILGARVVDRNDDYILISANERHAELVLYKARENKMRACGLEAASVDAVDEVRRRCNTAGLRVLSSKPSLPCIDKSVTFATTEGHVFEVHSAMPLDRPSRYYGSGVHPKCLDHVNFTAIDPAQWSREMEGACGFHLSQRTSGYEIVWLRAADGRHHTIAAVKSAASGVHHISWEFNAFEDFKKLGDALTVGGRRLIWGPGRHGAGDNLFLYYENDAGFMMECIAEMEVIYDDSAEPRIVDPGENLSNWRVVNQWGALPPKEWIEYYTPIQTVLQKEDA
jgi:catechol 2,3-dioxygenase